VPKVPRHSYRVFWSREDKEFVATCRDSGIVRAGADRSGGYRRAEGRHWRMARTSVRARHAVAGTEPRGIG
jgi:hypothetical protein